MKQLPVILSIVALAVSSVALYKGSTTSKTTTASNTKQGGEASKTTEQGNFKIAYFEMDSIENNYQYVKDSYKQVKSKEEAIGNDLGAMERNYQKKIGEWQKKGAQMSQSESEQVQREYGQMQQNYQAKKVSLEQELNDLRNKKLRDIQIKIEEYLKEFNKSKNYSFVFSYEPALFIYYKDSAFNITPELLQGLNDEYARTKGKEEKK
ncbi:MAG: OmpH family outer membrane protein [Chitinophagaceae bacterium]|nr:OmpH family outer membrane protein [Chitinophagaceae bacterium]